MSQDTQTSPLLPHAITGQMTPERVRQFWIDTRKSLLEQVDAIERLLCIAPRTAEIRQAARQSKRCDPPANGDRIEA